MTEDHNSIGERLLAAFSTANDQTITRRERVCAMSFIGTMENRTDEYGERARRWKAEHGHYISPIHHAWE